TWPVRPLLDVEALLEASPAAADHPGGPVGFYLQHAHAGAPVPALGPRSWPRFVEQCRQQSRTLQMILDAGVFDQDHYEQQVGAGFLSERQAVWHFLEVGESDALSPSPLYERSWYRSKAGVTMPLTFRHFLRTGQVEGAAGPHFDGATHLARVPEAAEHPGGPLGHFLAHAGDETLTVPAPDSGVEPVAWGVLRTALRSAAVRPDTSRVDWPSVDTLLERRVPGRISLLVTTRRDRHLVRDAVEHALALTDRDVEVVVVDHGSERDVTAILTAVFAADDRVRVIAAATDEHPGGARDVALGVSTGEIVVVMANDVRPREGWLAPLVDALVPGVVAAQPLILSADDTVWSAGLVSHGQHVVPGHLLAGHPAEDVPDRVTPDGVSGACFATRAADLVRMRGLDPAMGELADADLSLRLAAGGRFETVTTSVVSRQLRIDGAAAEPDQLAFLRRWGAELPLADATHWTGLAVDGWRPGGGLPVSRRRTTVSPLLSRAVQVVPGGPAAGLPRLRWAIKIAAKGGPLGDEWGDTYFADDLVRGLRRWGQEAFVDRRGAHERPGSDHLDDVTLTLRGRWPAVRQPGATNLLWVISHPDEVPDDEITQGFDLVYAAGRTWADQTSARTSQPVRTLLQATDTSRFTPEGDAMDGLGTLFVGRTRKVQRPVVRDAVAAGADLTVFGDGWGEFIDDAFVRADHLDNALVPAAYRGARVVLNDHWADMAQLGFYSNRLFDAVASGARVVTDPVDGVEELFGPSVRTYGSVDELRALLDPTSTAWADDGAILANARRVAAEHSFATRARALLADVLDARGVQHDLRDRGE
ncbi:MAG: glycosyltransferase, partial [Aeromicrobium sp.]